MSSEKGNYVPWSVAQILSGALCAGLTLFWGGPAFIVIPASLSVLVIYKLLFRWEHRATRGEMQAMLRVFSLSSLATLGLLTLFHGLLDGVWINALWGTALVSRGVFGLVFFAGTGGIAPEKEGKDQLV